MLQQRAGCKEMWQESLKRDFLSEGNLSNINKPVGFHPMLALLRVNPLKTMDMIHLALLIPMRFTLSVAYLDTVHGNFPCWCLLSFAFFKKATKQNKTCNYRTQIFVHFYLGLFPIPLL